MSNPLVSYVLTAYNVEEFIEESVKCAFSQTYENLEIILSDDCSTDNTFNIMKKMADEYDGPHKIVLNRNEKNLGISQHMSKCYIDLANGDFIVAAHGDDISIPDRTGIEVNFLLNNPEYTAVSMGVIATDEDGKILKNKSHNAVVDNFHSYDFETGGNIPAPSRAFRKKVMSEFGYLNEECPTEDELITFRALLMGKNGFLPQVSTYYRKHETSSSNPEFFNKFPLEKILEQQNDDMEKAVKMGLITEKQKQNKYEELYKNMIIRKRYRNYFKSRTVLSLFQLILPNDIRFKAKISYIKQHILYLINK